MSEPTGILAHIAPKPQVESQATPETVTEPQAPEPSKSKLTKALPTDRLSWDTQVLLIRCFGIAANANGGKPVTNAELAKYSSLNPKTVNLNNMFWLEMGFLTKAINAYTPVAEVLSYDRAYQFNSETAGQKLAPAFRRSWAGQALLPRLAARPISEDDALGELADACHAGPEHRNQLLTLLDFLALGAVIVRDGTTIKQGPLAREDGQIPRSEEIVTAQSVVAITPGTQGSTAPRAVNTSFAGGAAGALSLSVNIDVDMAQMGTWPPQTVAAFMAGLAQVITAKAAAEGSVAR